MQNLISNVNLASFIRGISGVNIAIFNYLLLNTLGNNSTFTRSTTATVKDFEGIIKTAKIDEVRFEGARRVENGFTWSEDMTKWTKIGASIQSNTTIAPNGKLEADTVNYIGTISWNIMYQGLFTGEYRWSGWVKTSDGTNKTIYVTYGVPDITKRRTLNITGEWKRYSALINPINENVHLGNQEALTPVGWSAFGIDVWGLQLEKVDGQTNTNPSEYVSSDVIKKNFYLQTEDYSQWIYSSGYLPPVLNSAIAPDGSLTADTVIDNTLAVGNHFGPYQTVTLVNTYTYIVSTYIKRASGTSTYPMLAGVGIGAISEKPIFDLENETVNLGATNTIVQSAGIQNVGNGWYRIWTTIANVATGNIGFGTNRDNFDNSNAGHVYTGDGTSGFYYWGGQIEVGTVMTDYQKITNGNPGDFNGYHGANVDSVKYFNYKNGNTVAGNIITEAIGNPIPAITLKGVLIEPQVTNLLFNSEDLNDIGWNGISTTLPLGMNLLNDDTPAIYISKFKTVTVPAVAGNIIASVLIKKGTQSLDNIPEIKYVNSTGVNDGTERSVQLNPTTGAIIIRLNGTSYLAPVLDTDYGVIDEGNFYRLWIKGITRVGQTSATITIWSAVTDVANFGGATPTAQGSIEMGKLQLETGNIIHNYIPALSASVTKSVDTLNYNTTTPTKDVSYVFDFTPYADGVDYIATDFRLFGTDDSRGINYEVRSNTGTSYSIIATPGGAQFRLKQADLLKGITYKIGLSLTQIGTQVRAIITLDGIVKSNILITVTLDHSNNNTLQIGNWVSNYISGDIKNFKMYNKGLTSNQLISLTN